MKRICVALCIAAAFSGVTLFFMPRPFYKAVAFFPEQSRARVFCRRTSLSAVDLGNGFLVECGIENLTETLKFCDSVEGISIKCEGDEEFVGEILQRLRVHTVKCQCLQGVTVISGYSAVIVGGVFADGQKINVQAAFDGQTVTVGSPLIPDSF